MLEVNCSRYKWCCPPSNVPDVGILHEILWGMLPPNVEGALSQISGYTLTQKLGMSEQFQWPLVGREQVVLLNLTLVWGTASHSLAPRLVKSKVQHAVPPGQVIAQQDVPGTVPTFLLRVANAFRLLPLYRPHLWRDRGQKWGDYGFGPQKDLGLSLASPLS